MTILNRPYAGNWAPNQRKIVQWTPDALVYLNGDTGLAGCPTCHHRIDVQQFVTSISVDAGVDPGASSASITLSIPRSYGDSIFRDGNTLLRNGLEVHVYLRGYFPMVGLADEDSDPNTDDAQIIAGVNLADIPQYPYYPVFHGVVTQVSHEYAGGYYSASLSCSGMLHFWQYMQISANGSFFGARPNNSGVRTSIRGHVYTGMSPFSIIYSLYRDTMGSAAGVGFALQSRTNMQAVSTGSGDSLYSLALQYWERRFAQGMYGLRMHGASGQLFSGSTQAYLARLGGADARVLSVVTGNDRRERDPLSGSERLLSGAAAFNLVDRDGDGRILRGADLRLLSSTGGASRDFGVVVPQMQAFVNDISQWGQVNMFETTYESKLDIATQVSNICGYEFYQDMDGDLVFKPPLYNLDTSSSRVYRIEPEDIISISFTENEPEATYATVSGGPFQNLRGAVDEAEWGVRSTYYDYRLIAQFGWREGSLESNYYSNARSAFYAAVANLDRINQGMNSASVTIPLRAEIRQGFPVYIPHIDCFYYVQSVSHAFTFGGACTTTLNLVARRRKFIPPGSTAGESIGSIDLGNTSLPPRSLQYLDNSGIPRILGFPNVVMALDPERINPLFFLFGLDAEEGGVLDRGDRLGGVEGGVSSAAATRRLELLASNFAQVMVENGILGVNPNSAPSVPEVASGLPTTTDDLDFDSPDADFRISGIAPVTTPTAEVTSSTPVTDVSTRSRGELIVGPWWISTSPTTGVPIDQNQLYDGLRALVIRRSAARRRITVLTREIQQRENRIQALGSRTAEERASTVAELSGEISTRRAEAERLNQFLSGTLSLNPITEDSTPEALVIFLISQVRALNPASAGRDMEVDSTGALNNSATILDLLNDRKAGLGLNTPGYYRYYSASHPNPNQQGYAPLTPTTSSGSDVNTVVGVETMTREDIGGENFEVNLNEEQLRNYVKLVNKVPVNGLNVRTFVSRDPTPTSTDQIFALSFEQRNATRWGRNLTFVVHAGRTRADIIQAFRQCIPPDPGTTGGSSPLGNALGDHFAEVCEGEDGGLSDLSITGGALINRALRGGISGLTAGRPSAPISSYDIDAGAVNNNALFNGAEVTNVALSTLGPADASAAERARTIFRNKGNNLVYQVTLANRDQIDRAITELTNAHPVTTAPVASTTSTATVPPPTPPSASGSDVSLARRAGIPPAVMRAIRAIESRGSANAVRFERRLFRERTGIQIDGTGTSRSTFDEVVRRYPQYRDEAIESTSWGLYQVLGRSLLVTHPSDPVGDFDRNPRGVSDDILVRYFEARPAARDAANAVGENPSEENIAALARLYNGRARDEDGSLTRWGERFSSALSSGASASSPRRTSTPSTGSGGGRVEITGDEARTLSGLLSQWMADIRLLFGGRMPGSLPFHFDYSRGLVEEAINSFSPVFPVSDSVGYETYGTYQYGRGLSIEPGGNYETLMGTDPFQYVDPDLAYAFANAVRQSGTGTGEEGSPFFGPQARAALEAIANDDRFAASPGADIAIRIFREDNPESTETDSTAMIASGLANYVMSDRDAITHLPVSNVAFRLADLNPNITGEDTCECRGAEADLLLGAYMSGSSDTTFVTVDTPDKASKWVAQQMVLAADSWTLSQTALRGASISPQGRRSVFDSVRGVLGIASQLTAPAAQLENDLEGVADPTSQNLRRLNEIASGIDRTV